MHGSLQHAGSCLAVHFSAGAFELRLVAAATGPIANRDMDTQGASPSGAALLFCSLLRLWPLVLLCFGETMQPASGWEGCKESNSGYVLYISFLYTATTVSTYFSISSLAR